MTTIKPMTWFDATKYVTKVNNEKIKGYDKWQLPTQSELRTLYDLSQYHPDYVNHNGGWFWSVHESSIRGRAIAVNGGDVKGSKNSFENYKKTEKIYVRLVAHNTM